MSAQGSTVRSRPLSAGLSLPAIIEQLKADGLAGANADQIAAAAIGRTDNRHPLVVLAERQWDDPRAPGRKLTLEALVQWLAQRSGVPFMRIDPLTVDVAKIATVIPYAYAARQKILPVRVSASEITVAVADPYNADWTRELEPVLKRPIQRVLANPLDIERYLVEFYALARSVKVAGRERAALPAVGVNNLEQIVELGRAGKLTADDQHIIAIVDWLLQYAFDSRASDIHLEPRRDAGRVRFRIDGVLHEVYQIPAPIVPAVVSRVKILTRMDLAEKRRPQDGRIKTRSPDGREIELRVSSLPTAFGEKLVLRIFNPEVLVKEFSALGFSEHETEAWRGMIDQPHGIVLVTGPTGSGKTTTLYSSLKQLATSEVNVCTIEDPIELIDPSFNQMQVQANIDLSFASGVRALLRQDPDIIMIGEIRDLETAEIAIQAALTGHLVLSTLHTNDAPSAVTRLMELGVPAYLIRATLIGVLAQRLLRNLCPHCKLPMELKPSRWRDVADAPPPFPLRAHQAVGCLECRETGYLGRSGIYEVMRITPSLREKITRETELDALRRAARQEGMRSLRMSGALKVAAGVSTIEEVLSVTPDPESLT